jgi:hypothetical protein
MPLKPERALLEDDEWSLMKMLLPVDVTLGLELEPQKVPFSLG